MAPRNKNTPALSTSHGATSIDTHLLTGFIVGTVLAFIFRCSEHWPTLRALTLDMLYPVGIFFLRICFILLTPFIFFSVAVAISTVRGLEHGLRMTVRLAGYYI